MCCQLFETSAAIYYCMVKKVVTFHIDNPNSISGWLFSTTEDKKIFLEETLEDNMHSASPANNGKEFKSNYR
jgi:hypothetical protein